MLDWYRRGLYGVFKWYKNFNGPESMPAAWATVIYFLCHCTNAATILVLYAKITGRSAQWTAITGSKLATIGMLASAFYVIYFIRVIRQMSDQANQDDDVAEALETHLARFPVYVIVSVLLLVASIVAFAA